MSTTTTRVIEARQFTLGDVEDLAKLKVGRTALEQWCGGTIVGFRLIVPTLEGDMAASPGDWIIHGVKGEFYPCKPDIFRATYERA